MEWTFEHEESQHLVYCRKGREAECEKVFKDGAPDTIIGLPSHIGSGPYARIVSMEPVDALELLDYHVRKRSMQGHESTVYKLTIDYQFEAIRREDARVNIRIDYTNLVPYWDEMTGDKSDDGVNSKRSAGHHEKRWFGPFNMWLKKLATVRNSDQGKLPLSIHKKMLLYSRRAQCARDGVLLNAGLDVTLDAKFDMNARWAYYAEGSIIPMNIDTVYAYFELEPEVEAVIEIEGSAEMEYRSPRMRIIDTLTYPGLAVKGIAAVGPSLDLWGQMAAGARIAGKLAGGAKVTFPRYEVYYPQNKDAEEYQRFLPPSPNQEKAAQGTEMVPILDASVEANVHIDFMITPEVNLGVKVKSPISLIKEIPPILDAQIIGFVNNTLRFEVEGKVTGGIGNPPAASYSVYIKYFYNFGIGGRAIWESLGSFALKPLKLWPGLGRQKILYEHHGSKVIGKRNPLLSDRGYGEKFIPLYNPTPYVDDDFYNSTSNPTRHLLNKRTTLAELPALGGKKSFFTCNDGGQCAGGACAGDTCDWNPATQAFSNYTHFAIAADDNDDDPMDVDSSQNCITAVPAFMYNCKYFPDENIPGIEGYHPGICRNIMEFFSRSGLGSGPFQATYRMAGLAGTAKEKNQNREVACGRYSRHDYSYTDHEGELQERHDTWTNKCTDISNVISDMLRRPHGVPGNKNWLSCDEFPFNTMEEGGNLLTIQRKCVPGWQQEIQSNLNNLPRKVLQEVTWTDPKGDQQTEFKKWTTDWVPKRAKWNSSEAHRKSYTFHIFNSDSDTSQSGAKYQVFNHDLVAQNGAHSDITEVVGAINHFGNPKYKFENDINAWCLNSADGPRNHDMYSDNYPPFIRINECKVVFDNTAATTKFKRGEQPTEEEMFQIKSIEIPEDAPSVEIPLPVETLNPVPPAEPEKAGVFLHGQARQHMRKHGAHL